MRRGELYISRENKRALYAVARSEGTAVSIDEVGDRLLSWAISQKYPALASYQKQISELEIAMAEAIQGNK